MATNPAGNPVGDLNIPMNWCDFEPKGTHTPASTLALVAAASQDSRDLVIPVHAGMDGMAFNGSVAHCPEFPDDPAGIVYQNKPDWTDGLDGWNAAGGGASAIVESALRFTHTGANQYLHRGIAIPAGQEIIFKARLAPGTVAPISNALKIVNVPATPAVLSLPASGEWVTYRGKSTAVSTSIGFYLGTLTDAGSYDIEISDIYLGNGNYLPGAMLDLASKSAPGRLLGGAYPVETRFGKGIKFNGTSARAINKIQRMDQFAFFMVITPDSVGTSIPICIGGGFWDIGIIVESTRFKFFGYNTEGGIYSISSAVLTTATEYRVWCIFTGSKLIIDVNGDRRETQFVGTLRNSGDVVTLGASSSNPINYFPGTVVPPIFYARIPTEAEIYEVRRNPARYKSLPLPAAIEPEPWTQPIRNEAGFVEEPDTDLRTGLVFAGSVDHAPEFPDDPAGIVYQSKKDWAGGVDGWGGAQYCDAAIEGGKLKLTVKDGQSLLHGLRAFSGGIGARRWLIMRVKVSRGGGLAINGTVDGVANTTLRTADNWAAGEERTLRIYVSGNLSYFYFTLAGCSPGDYLLIDFFQAGTGNYLSGSVLDVSGNRHGQILGGAAPVETKFGRGLKLTGQKGYARAVNLAPKRIASMVCACASETFNSASSPCSTLRHQNSSNGLAFAFSSNTSIRAYYGASGQGGQYVDIGLTSPIVLGELAVYALQFEADGRLRFYRNAVLLGSSSPVTPVLESGQWTIGRWSVTYEDYYFVGTVLPPLFYEQPLSPADLYAATRAYPLIIRGNPNLRQLADPLSTVQRDDKGRLCLGRYTPASSTEAGIPGATCYDDQYSYIWTAANQIKRTPLATW